MRIEYDVNSILTDQELKDSFKKAKELKIDSVSINRHQYRITKFFFDDSKINIKIDNPLGISGTSSRINEIIETKKQGSILSIQCPSSLLVNRKYDQIRKELSQIIELVDNKKEIRFIIDYRHYNHNILCKFCSILKEHKIEYIYPSSGFFIDDMYDQIIACNYLHKKSNINTIFNANFWTEQHVATIININPSIISINNLRSIELVHSYGK
jgi:deoxyribose-phosphate aldolase